MASPRRPAKPYHHGDLRRALLDAALALLREEGLAGLSLRECARRLGVSHAAPYRHFKDKNELLLAIAEEGFEALAAVGEAAMEGVTDPVARMDAYGAAYVRFAFEHPEHHRVMFTAELEAPDGAGLGGRAFDLLVEVASEAAGPSTDPLLAAFAQWAIPHGLAMLILDGRVPRDRVKSADAVEELARAAFDVVRGRSAAAPKKRKR